jgi:hypothetical protein
MAPSWEEVLAGEDWLECPECDHNRFRSTRPPAEEFQESLEGYYIQRRICEECEHASLVAIAESTDTS